MKRTIAILVAALLAYVGSLLGLYEDAMAHLHDAIDWYEQMVWLVAYELEQHDWFMAFKASHGLHLLTGLCYVISIAILMRIATKDHAAKVRSLTGEERYVSKYPSWYFVTLIIQLVPTTISGIVHMDLMVILTRAGMLGATIAAYALVATRDGTFESPRIMGIIIVGVSIAVLGPLGFAAYEGTDSFIADWEKAISAVAIATAFLFMIFGQGATLRTLFVHYLTGVYGFKSFSQQVSRFLGFFFQVPIFIVLGGLSSLFLQVFLNAMGAGAIVFFSLIGMLIGFLLSFFRKPVPIELKEDRDF